MIFIILIAVCASLMVVMLGWPEKDKIENIKVDINEVCEWLSTHLYNHYEKYQKGPYVASNCHESVERLISEFRRYMTEKNTKKEA